MLKVIGIGLVLMGSSGYGMRLYLDLKEGTWHLRWWIMLLERVMDEVEHQNLSLPECICLELKHASDDYKGMLEEILRKYEMDGRNGISHCFREAVLKRALRLPLKKEEKEIITNLLEELPIYNQEMQIKLLNHKKVQLEKCLLDRERELREKKKVYTSLGVMGGLLLILILV